MQKQVRCLCSRVAVWGGAILLLAAASVAAQGATKHGPGYDSKSEVTVEGIIEQVQQATGKQSLMGTHLLLDSAGTIIDVQAGPEGFLASSGVIFAPGDAVKVTGAMTDFKGTSILLARTITRGSLTLVVRNAVGLAVQSPGERGNRAASAKSRGGF